MNKPLKVFLLFSIAFVSSQNALSQKHQQSTINFEISQVQSCEKSKDIEQCLKNIFGSAIGYSIINEKKIRSVNYPRMRNGALKINGTSFIGLFNPSIVFFSENDSYSICGTMQPIKMGRFTLTGRGGNGCICGFNSKGEFSLSLDSKWTFLPANLEIRVASMLCRPDGKFSTNGVTLMEKANICGYDFPKDTEFYFVESNIAFKASRSGFIDGKGGQQIEVKKGKEYMSNSSLEKPCNWEPVIEYDESGLPITD